MKYKVLHTMLSTMRDETNPESYHRRDDIVDGKEFGAALPRFLELKAIEPFVDIDAMAERDVEASQKTEKAKATQQV